MTRGFAYESSPSVMIAADASDSTPLRGGRESIATVVALTVATLALAAAFFQHPAASSPFHRDARRIAGAPPAPAQPRHPLRGRLPGPASASLRPRTASHPTFAKLLPRRSLVPGISDFLFEDTAAFLTELPT